MKFKDYLNESLDSSYKQIIDIFKNTITKYSKDYEIRTDFRSGYLRIKFWNKNKNYCEQSLDLSIRDGILELWDVYLPEVLRGKGFLTEILSQLRKLNCFNGKCNINVAMNTEGWKTIIKRAGFEWDKK